jgi:hypothetical protein
VNVRWAARIIGIILVLLFFVVMANLQRRLVDLQRVRKPAATTPR